MFWNHKNYKLIMSCIIVGIFVFLSVSLFRSNKQLTDTRLAVEYAQKSLDEQIRPMAAEIKVIKKQIEKKGIEINKEEYFPIYGPDRDAMAIEVNFYVGIPNNTTLQSKLEILVDRLSRFRFDYHPVELVDIEMHQGKKVAVINLKEKPSFREKNHYGRSWAGNYFQGSTGASMTWATLEKTLLQRKYEGSWIDGLKLLYEGEALDEEKFEHLGEIPNVIWR